MAVAELPGQARLIRARSTALASAVGVLLTVTGCGHEEPGRGAGTACLRAEDGGGPPVSFETDVMPLFSLSCTFGACHDSASRSAGLYLGPSFLDGPASAAARAEVLSALLSTSTTAPELSRVQPFDPARSFLILKVQGCQNQVGLTCGGALPAQPCGARMPALSDELPEDRRALLWRWIFRGAHGP